MAKQGEIIKNYDKSPEMGEVDYVVEWQKPTEKNGYTWYRLYASGWIIVGGKHFPNQSSSYTVTITLPKTMIDTNYLAFRQSEFINNGNSYAAFNNGIWLNGFAKTTTQFSILTEGTAWINSFNWIVMGYAV